MFARAVSDSPGGVNPRRTVVFTRERKDARMPNRTQITVCSPRALLSARHADAIPVALANLRVVDREVVSVRGAHLCRLVLSPDARE